MIYRFKSKASGDVVMLQPTGERVLRALGREPLSRGILQAGALPMAIEALVRAIEEDDRQRTAATAPDDEAAGDERADAEQGVPLRRRAWPMLEMMRRCAAAQEPIVWGV